MQWVGAMMRMGRYANMAAAPSRTPPIFLLCLSSVCFFNLSKCNAALKGAYE